MEKATVKVKCIAVVFDEEEDTSATTFGVSFFQGKGKRNLNVSIPSLEAAQGFQVGREYNLVITEREGQN